MTEEKNSRIKRLRYRSWHRGCKETDLILGRFADEKLDKLPPALWKTYEELLNENDADIWDWVNGRDAPAKYAELLDMMKRIAISD